MTKPPKANKDAHEQESKKQQMKRQPRETPILRVAAAVRRNKQKKATRSRMESKRRLCRSSRSLAKDPDPMSHLREEKTQQKARTPRATIYGLGRIGANASLAFLLANSSAWDIVSDQTLLRGAYELLCPASRRLSKLACLLLLRLDEYLRLSRWLLL